MAEQKADALEHNFSLFSHKMALANQKAGALEMLSQMGHIGQGQSVGRGQAQDLQAEILGQAGQMTCYHCRQPGHRRQDCPRRQRSHSTETENSD